MLGGGPGRLIVADKFFRQFAASFSQSFTKSIFIMAAQASPLERKQCGAPMALIGDSTRRTSANIRRRKSNQRRANAFHTPMTKNDWNIALAQWPQLMRGSRRQCGGNDGDTSYFFVHD